MPKPNLSWLLKRAGEVNEPEPDTHPSAPVEKLRPRAEVILYNAEGIWGIIMEKEGYLRLPGGGIAPGERPLEAAIRETMEEADRICHNIEDRGSESAMYDPNGFRFKDWDGETTYFFIALDGGPAEMNHQDKEDFYIIPYADAKIYLNDILNMDDQGWAYNNNLKRLRLVQAAQRKMLEESGLEPIKYAGSVIDKVARICKLGKERREPRGFKDGESTFIRDFAAGVEPTGTYTFESARRNEKNHARHKAINMAGGFIGGAAVIPGVISALALGVPQYVGAGKGRSLKLIGDAAIKPYRLLVEGALARRELSNILKNKSDSTAYIGNLLGHASLHDLASMSTGIAGKADKKMFSASAKRVGEKVVGVVQKNPSAPKLQTMALEHTIRGYSTPAQARKMQGLTKDVLLGPPGALPAAADKTMEELPRLLRQDANMALHLKKNINQGLYSGIGVIGLSGATNSLSAMAQYNSGLKSKRPLRRNSE